MLTTNKERVIKTAVVGKIRQHCCSGYSVTNQGEAVVLPGIGGIVYNAKIGDPVFGWAGDHIEPGVSVYNPNKRDSDSMNILACIGNEAIVMDGDAKGARGYVTGKHGGAEDVMVYFDDDTLDKLCIGDKILIRACGQGLRLKEYYDDIKIQCIDPGLFEKLGIEENGDGTLTVPVAAKVPPYLLGSGMGASNAYRGDYDIMTADQGVLEECGLTGLRFGDIVLLEDADNLYGRGYRKGATSIGVIIHSDCVLSGHGPGVTTVLVSQEPILKGRITPDANIANYLGVR